MYGAFKGLRENPTVFAGPKGIVTDWTVNGGDTVWKVLHSPMETRNNHEIALFTSPVPKGRQNESRRREDGEHIDCG